MSGLFLEIEGGNWVNLSLISRVEFYDRLQECSMWNAGVREGDNSKIAYAFFKDPANAAMLKAGWTPPKGV
jgi:hypothetical protein